MAARGVGLERAAEELGVTAADLRAWSRVHEGAPLVVPVQIEAEAVESRGLVVVLAGGVRVERLTLADVVELVRRLS